MRCGGESYSLEEWPWGHGGGKELAFTERLLCSRHFTQISSFNVVLENQGSGVGKVWG